jgi:hypothetical protein
MDALGNLGILEKGQISNEYWEFKMSSKSKEMGSKSKENDKYNRNV